MDEPTKVYRVEEVAKFLQVTPWTVRQWIQKRRIAAYKIGREWRITRAEVDRLLGHPPDNPSDMMT